MRGRSYSYSPPPRGYGRRHRSPSPRGRYGGRGRDMPTSLLVRNLRHDCRPEDLRGPFGQFGHLKDIYLPRDYYTGELTVVFAEENRKKPSEMRARERVRGQSYDRRRSPLEYSRSPRYVRSYSRSPDYYSPPPRQRRYSRSMSPRDRRYRGRSYSKSPYSRSRSRSRSKEYNR
ncbi:serine/arginine-rich SC35-like splicing factor SCL33 isoform X2 [Mangifera indica]|uniref:serine/arginine-rich SC35-like splicing factor SCL33 isoform X2 n=1 Tax=Mangifera indica TaxID=29780 RepID=UPI001CF9CB08|nr:serine/arginine-rich SC35-like splicing factor SCL33 isoform X2 [Mangifera indica]